MFTKTTAIFGLVAASGVMAGEYPAYKADNATSMAMPTAKGTAAPTPVWQYYNMTVPTTVVVPQFTTVCPEAATLTYNEVPYTVTKGQTLTVTDCPCTVTKVSQCCLCGFLLLLYIYRARAKTSGGEDQQKTYTCVSKSCYETQC